MDRIAEIKYRLAGVSDGHYWKFNQKHEMFVGHTNAIEMWDRNLDLGREDEVWVPYDDENSKGYKLSPQSARVNKMTKALGEFLESCRDDIQFLLAEVERLSAGAR